MQYNFSEGWNFVSLPCEVSDNHFQSVFPDAAPNSLYSFDSAYNSDTYMTPGVGYWLRFDTDTSGEIACVENITNLTVHYYSDGWQLIGSLSGPVGPGGIIDPTGIIETVNVDGDFLFEFDGTYSAVQVIEPTKAYWIRLSSGGPIILQSQDSPPVLTFQDGEDVPYIIMPGGLLTLDAGSTRDIESCPNGTYDDGGACLSCLATGGDPPCLNYNWTVSQPSEGLSLSSYTDHAVEATVPYNPPNTEYVVQLTVTDSGGLSSSHLITIQVSDDPVGCMNPDACNYDPSATIDDGSCWNIGEFICPNPPIGDQQCCDCDGNVDDGCGECGGPGPLYECWNGDIVCSVGYCTDELILGCTDSNACNYNPSVNTDDNSCVDVAVVSCWDDENEDGYYDDEILDVSLCPGVSDNQFDYPTDCGGLDCTPGPCQSDSTFPPANCMDPDACNYNSDATEDDPDSCEYDLGCGCDYPGISPDDTVYSCYADPDENGCYSEEASINACPDLSCEDLGQPSQYVTEYGTGCVFGCMDPNACDYDPDATEQEGVYVHDWPLSELVDFTTINTFTFFAGNVGSGITMYGRETANQVCIELHGDEYSADIYASEHVQTDENFNSNWQGQPYNEEYVAYYVAFGSNWSVTPWIQTYLVWTKILCVSPESVTCTYPENYPYNLENCEGQCCEGTELECSEAHPADCLGECDGPAYVDDCGVCGYFPPGPPGPIYDCPDEDGYNCLTLPEACGDPNGSGSIGSIVIGEYCLCPDTLGGECLVVDDCGVCGGSGFDDQGCCSENGQPYYDGTADCFGGCGESAYLDECGVCGSPPPGAQGTCPDSEYNMAMCLEVHETCGGPGSIDQVHLTDPENWGIGYFCECGTIVLGLCTKLQYWSSNDNNWRDWNNASCDTDIGDWTGGSSMYRACCNEACDASIIIGEDLDGSGMTNGGIYPDGEWYYATGDEACASHWVTGCAVLDECGECGGPGVEEGLGCTCDDPVVIGTCFIGGESFCQGTDNSGETPDPASLCPPIILGCNNPYALNYDPNVNYPVWPVIAEELCLLREGVASLEDVLDKIAITLITEFDAVAEELGIDELSEQQKAISEDGLIAIGRDSETQRLVLYSHDVVANREDLSALRDLIIDTPIEYEETGLLSRLTININVGPPLDIDILYDDNIIAQSIQSTSSMYRSILNNLGQFLELSSSVQEIDPEKAQQTLSDKNIYELLPTVTTRQDMINKFFRTYSELRPRAYPEWSDTDEDGLTDYLSQEDEDSFLEDSATTQGISDDGNYIDWRLEDENNYNTDQSLEWLRDDLQQYFDVPGSTYYFGLKEYEHRSSGYLKIRNLNQMVIVRNDESDDIGLSDWQTDGFTITMWVKFLNDINDGTLFNLGNPLREEDSEGITLETFIKNEKRYIRLIIRDHNDYIRDSHFGVPGTDRSVTSGVSTAEYLANYNNYNYIEVPADTSEWYFIVATYNPSIDEDNSFAQTFDTCNSTCLEDPDYWRWNIDTDGYTSKSGHGARCKVEIISKRDLLTARGYNVENL